MTINHCHIEKLILMLSFTVKDIEQNNFLILKRTEYAYQNISKGHWCFRFFHNQNTAVDKIVLKD